MELNGQKMRAKEKAELQAKKDQASKEIWTGYWARTVLRGIFDRVKPLRAQIREIEEYRKKHAFFPAKTLAFIDDSLNRLRVELRVELAAKGAQKPQNSPKTPKKHR